MNRTVIIANPSLLEIRDGGSVYLGGNQEWFSSSWQRKAGCGPTNCANLMRYLAATRESCKPLCPYNANEKSGFVQLMEDVWQHLTPGNMGVNSTRLFMQGAKSYSDAKGVALIANSLPVPPLHNGRRSYEGVSAFILSSLESNLPVAFLNLSNGTLDNLDSWHWVTIISLRETKAEIYDQGKSVLIDLQQWLASSVMGGGFVSLDIASYGSY